MFGELDLSELPGPYDGSKVTSRIFAKLVFAGACMLLVALAAVDILISRVAEAHYRETLIRDLRSKGEMLALCPPGQAAELARVAALRLTIVDDAGHVRVDSEADPLHMESHRERPEILEALSGRYGNSIRRSPTLGIDFLYVAVPYGKGALRLAMPLSDVSRQVNALRLQTFKAALIAFVPAILVAGFFARRVSRRLARIIEFSTKLAKGDLTAKLHSSSGDELGILATTLNETARNLEQTFGQLQSERKEMEKLDRVRKDFVINVSHELRTPLASIQGYTETLLDGALHDVDNNVRFLSIIRQNAERLGRLLEDLITISRLELRTQHFQFAAYYVNDLLAECVDTMMPMAEKKRITLSQELAGEEAEVFCDAEAVHQILMNLLDNAVKYTPEGGSVVVGARPIARDRFEFHVRDTGMGIPAEDLPHLFERFYRVDKARSRELGGTGLGLAIVKHLVRAQGGEVRVESRLGQGSLFSFTLPVHDLGLSEHVTIQEEPTVS